MHGAPYLVELEEGIQFDLIIAADVVCCANDTAAVTATLSARLLKPRVRSGDDFGGMGILLLPADSHR